MDTELHDYNNRNDLHYGVCVCSLDGKVVYQNDICRKLCGDQKGLGCSARLFSPCKTSCSKKSHRDSLHTHRPELAVDSQEVFQLVTVNNEDHIEVQIHPVTHRFRAPLERVSSSGLTRKQREIAFLRVLGHEVDEICVKLKISRNTLKTHLKNIYARVTPSVRKLIGENV